MDEGIKELAARAAHEVNRAYCEGLGDLSQKPWAEAPEWQRHSCRCGVEGVANGNGPEQSHESWTAQKISEGWVFGPIKDPEAKTHPCLVPYADLPPQQKLKDALFVAVVTAVVEGMGGVIRRG